MNKRILRNWSDLICLHFIILWQKLLYWAVLIVTDFSHKSKSCVSPVVSSQTAVWVNFFFWLIIGILVIIQRRQTSASKTTAGGYGGPAGGLFGDPGATAAETEPIFSSPPRPQWARTLQRNYRNTCINWKWWCGSRCGKMPNPFSV